MKKCLIAVIFIALLSLHGCTAREETNTNSLETTGRTALELPTKSDISTDAHNTDAATAAASAVSTESDSPNETAASTANTESDSPNETAASTASTESGSPNEASASETALEESAIEESEPYDEEFVEIDKYIPTVVTDLRYASENNFTGKKIYTFSEAYLRYGTVKKLKQASLKLQELGYAILIWDAYRPIEAQRALWNAYPDPRYVSNPDNGNTSHERGNTIDISLIGIDGKPVEMPTDFDDFSLLADREYSDCSKTASENAEMLEEIMIECGFNGYYGEWWHFSDTEQYPTEYSFIPEEE